MKTVLNTIRAKVWIYKGNSPWHFVTIEKTVASEIKKQYMWPRRGFGSIPVNVTIGKTKWKTSIFPDKNKTFVLPLKKEVRLSEDIKVGDNVKFSLEVLN